MITTECKIHPKTPNKKPVFSSGFRIPQIKILLALEDFRSMSYVMAECVSKTLCYRYQPQTGALCPRPLDEPCLEVPDMHEHDSLHFFGPTTTSSQPKLSMEVMLRNSMKVPPVACETAHEAMNTLARASGYEHPAPTILGIATANPLDTGSGIINLLRCKTDVIGMRYRGVLKPLQRFIGLTVMFVQPTAVAASPVGSNLQMTGKFPTALYQQFQGFGLPDKI
jgi:hypothetical protein